MEEGKTNCPTNGDQRERAKLTVHRKWASAERPSLFLLKNSTALRASLSISGPSKVCSGRDQVSPS